MPQLETDSPDRSLDPLAASNDLLTVVDEDCYFVYCSPSVDRILGYDQDALVDQYAFEYVHPDDQRAAYDLLTELFDREESTTERIEFRMRCADSGYSWLEAVCSNEWSEELGGYVINARDITERKRRELRLTEQNEQLDRFASIVSHDLRNPLTIIQGAIEMAQKTGEVDHLERGERAVDRMDQLISELLTLAKQGEQIDEVSDFDLGLAAREAWGAVDTGYAELVVETDITVRADRSRTRQALENLFRNSVEHGIPDEELPDEPEDAPDPDEVDPLVTVELGETDNGFYVADDGPGIPREKREQVFEPGFTTHPDGTGYGLDIVREIVEAHGWRIEIATEAEGARFEVAADGLQFVPETRLPVEQ